jgi:hypothetical protein
MTSSWVVGGPWQHSLISGRVGGGERTSGSAAQRSASCVCVSLSLSLSVCVCVCVSSVGRSIAHRMTSTGGVRFHSLRSFVRSVRSFGRSLSCSVSLRRQNYLPLSRECELRPRPGCSFVYGGRARAGRTDGRAGGRTGGHVELPTCSYSLGNDEPREGEVTWHCDCALH